MIPPERFIVRSTERERWLHERTNRISATTVAKAATPSGFKEVVTTWGEDFEPNEYMLFGTEQEPELLRHAHHEYGILASDWLIAGETDWHAGTPDGLSLDHTLIAEAKTGGTIPKSVKREHRDQCLWNLHVTGAERCLYLFNQRVPDGHGWFFLGLIEPVTFWVDRDEKRIRELIGVADRLREVLHGELQPC